MSFFDQGKRDGKKGKYKPPPRIRVSDIIAPKQFVDQKRQRRESYDRGYKKGRRG